MLQSVFKPSLILKKLTLWFETLSRSSFRWDYGNGYLSAESPRFKFDTDESINDCHAKIRFMRGTWLTYAVHSKLFGCSRHKFW